MEADRELDRVAGTLGTMIEVKRGPRYVYCERKGTEYPAREEFYPVAPSQVQTMARYAIERFAGQWTAKQR